MRTGPLKVQFITFRRPKPRTRGSSLADMPRKRLRPCGTRNKKSSRETSGTTRTIDKYWSAQGENTALLHRSLPRQQCPVQIVLGRDPSSSRRWIELPSGLENRDL